MQMKDCIFSGKDPVPITTFLQELEEVCGELNIHEAAVILLYKHYLTGSVKAVTKAGVALLTGTARSKEGFLTSFSATAN